MTEKCQKNLPSERPFHCQQSNDMTEKALTPERPQHDNCHVTQRRIMGPELNLLFSSSPQKAQLSK